jgi:hypothetical protein
MHDDLEKERKTMTRLWAKREQQIRGVIESTAGMYGERLAQPPGCLGVFQGRARPPAGRQDRLRRSAPPTPGANATRKPSANTASLSPATTPSASNSAEPLAAEPADLGRTPMVLVRAYRAPARHPRFPRDGPQPAGVVRIALRKLGLDESASA